MLEATHATTLASLQNANTEITRLSTLTARSAGWERKLQNLESLNEDLSQELEYSRKAESRVISLEAKCERLLEENAKLKLDVSRIETNVKTEREESARDARVRLENLLASVRNLIPLSSNLPLTGVKDSPSRPRDLYAEPGSHEDPRKACSR